MLGTRVHISIKTAKLAESVAFYRDMLGTAPLKNYPDYAKFDMPTPGLNLTLNQVAVQPKEQAIDHLGIEFATREDVAKMVELAKAKGFQHHIEQETSCCYGVQDKVWVVDPNGIRWELYTILVADTGVSGCSIPNKSASTSEEGCCGTSLSKEPVMASAGGCCDTGNSCS